MLRKKFVNENVELKNRIMRISLFQNKDKPIELATCSLYGNVKRDLKQITICLGLYKTY